MFYRTKPWTDGVTVFKLAEGIIDLDLSCVQVIVKRAIMIYTQVFATDKLRTVSIRRVVNLVIKKTMNITTMVVVTMVCIQKNDDWRWSLSSELEILWANLRTFLQLLLREHICCLSRELSLSNFKAQRIVSLAGRTRQWCRYSGNIQVPQVGDNDWFLLQELGPCRELKVMDENCQWSRAFFSRRTWGRISCRNQFTSEFLKISGEQYWDDLRRTFKQPFYSNQFCLVEVRFRSTWAWTTISSRRSKANFNLRNTSVTSFCIAWDPLSFSFSICPLWKSWRTVGSKSRLTVLFFQWVRYSTSIE